MKRYKLELLLSVVAIMAVGIMLTCSAGCSTARGNRAAGGLIVSAAVMSQEVDAADLRLARDYLEYVQTLLEADGSDVPLVLADVIRAEFEKWGEALTADERLAVGSIVDLFWMCIPADENTDETPMLETMYEEDTAKQLAHVVQGMITQIDRLTGE